MEVFFDSALGGVLLGIVIPHIVQAGKLLGLRAKQSLAILCCAVAFGIGILQAIRLGTIDLLSLVAAGVSSLGVSIMLYEYLLKRVYALSSSKDIPDDLSEELTEPHE